ncbi:uncharacterized protein LOC100371622 [Saccoglossus kowalevskii]|uniref:Uncharacterized protein LOC100371622 n=1 Tax=Saccoglossus kowalevskii TaxID=10224 RepID=A0ABM0MDP3_SACKO|nr:PREDICTED: uncharacterized protein LOC100371622 [Saccoglossus kowalevskii]
MVATRHCCYGLCRSDSRYGYRESMKGVYFIPFPKPHLGMEKSLRWVRACRRENFTVSNITKDTYICSLHFIGGEGPTAEHPDPIPATATSTQVQQMKKRKAPTNRQAAPPPGKRKTVVEDGIDNEMADTLLDLAQNEINTTRKWQSRSLKECTR